MKSVNFRDHRGRFGNSHAEEDCSSLGSDVDESEIDIDFSVTESGRTVAHLVAAMKDGENDDAFDITESGRTIGSYSIGTESMNDVTMSARTIGTYSMGGDSVQSNDLMEAIPESIRTIPVPVQQRSPARPIPPPNNPVASQASSAGSTGSGFLNEVMNQSGTNALSHTPPILGPSSYEAQHFGKRPRSGSISGRLRSASELEEKGVIDRHQKGILKDLLIAGDEELQAALDKYERGDRSSLETMLQGGALMNRASNNVNLLDELDLDFLTVDDNVYSNMAAAGHPLARATSLPMYNTTQTVPQSATMFSYPGKLDNMQQMAPQPNMVSPSLVGDDGIGELDFNPDMNPDLGGGIQSDELLKLPGQSFSSNRAAVPSPNLLEGQQRFRSNSLAFGGLLSEIPASAERQEMYGGWMDRGLSGSVPPIGQQSQGGLFLNPTAPGVQRGQGGLAASLAQYGKSKSESKLKTKSELAEEKRREKREKKEQKEREKREKKERRSLEMKEKKERAALEKQEKKYKKAAKSKLKEDDDDRMETPSGLGRPRSMSDPNLKTSVDEFGLLEVERPDGWIGAYSPESRKIRIERFLAKRNNRVWTKTVKYDVRKNFADSRLRVKGRFVKKEDEMLMRELMSLT